MYVCFVLFIAAVGDSLATLIAGVMAIEHSIRYESKRMRGVMLCSVLIGHFCGEIAGGLGSISVVANDIYFYKASVSKVFGSMAALSAVILAPTLFTFLVFSNSPRQSSMDFFVGP